MTELRDALIERFDYLARLSNSPHIWEKAAGEVRALAAREPRSRQPALVEFIEVVALGDWIEDDPIKLRDQARAVLRRDE